MAWGGGNLGSGGGFTKSVIIATALTGSTIICTKGTTVKTAREKNGEWWFKNLDIGTWTVKATLSGQTETQTVNITQFGVYRVAITYRITPEFTYTGDYEIVSDMDVEIPDFATWKWNWKIRFLTSGAFTVTNMHGWKDNRIDVFLVGGAGSGASRPSGTGNNGAGGGGGYTKTQKAVSIVKNTKYQITIGAGGASVEGDPAVGKNGGNTSAFGYTVNGGYGGGTASKDGTVRRGGDGGSGGGSGEDGPNPGGTDGSNGQGESEYVGHGQGTTTREFGEADKKLYSAGGEGGSRSPTSGAANTGDGGDGSKGDLSGSGGSGIVIIRNAQ